MHLNIQWFNIRIFNKPLHCSVFRDNCYILYDTNMTYVTKSKYQISNEKLQHHNVTIHKHYIIHTNELVRSAVHMLNHQEPLTSKYACQPWSKHSQEYSNTTVQRLDNESKHQKWLSVTQQHSYRDVRSTVDGSAASWGDTQRRRQDTLSTARSGAAPTHTVHTLV